MSIFELFLTACGLSMDAFAVSVTNGALRKEGQDKGSIDVRHHIRAFSGNNACDRLCAGHEFCGVHRAVRPLDSFDTAWVHRVEHDMRFGG